jgi:hypothetical protein
MRYVHIDKPVAEGNFCDEHGKAQKPDVEDYS